MLEKLNIKMEKKLSNIMLVSSLFFCFSYFHSCKKSEKIYGYENLNSIDVNKINLFQGKTLLKRVIFKNNPYEFNIKNSMVMYFNEDAVFNGKFEDTILLKVPCKYINSGFFSPILVIYSGEKKSYSFLHKQAIEIRDKDTYFEITFYEDGNITDAAKIEVR